MSTQAKTFLTPEEYLAIERRAERKSEYYKGEMFAMSGGSPRHGIIAVNISGELSKQLRLKPCTVYSSDVRLRVLPSGLYTYPDLTVVYGEPLYADDQKDTLLNPIVLVEVLSPSTRNYDRGEKFEFYRGMNSLREYVTVSQDQPHVELWSRKDENSWLLTEFMDLNQSVQLTSIGCVLKLSEVYLKVDWTA
jgi:Uma2 family endonuclease